MSNDPPAPDKPASHGQMTIRASRTSDAEALNAMMNLPGVRHGTLRPPFQRIEQSRAFLENLSGDDLHIVAEIDGVMVGNAGLHRANGRRRHVAGLGIAVHDDHAGRGIGSALVAALVDAADKWLDIHRIELTVFADNAAAIGLYRKFGLEQEGVLRDDAYRDGAYADVLAMARLRPTSTSG